MITSSTNNPLILNLSQLISKANITIPELAKNTKIPRSTIYQLLSEIHEPRLALLKILAKFFSINVSQLIGELPLTNNATAIPVHSWNNLDYNSGRIDNSAHIPKFVLVEKISNFLFAISAEKDVYPKYEEGTILIFEETQAFTTGDIILISQQKTKPVLKTALIEGTETYFKSVSNDIPAQVYDPTNTVIFGVLREIRISKF